MAQQNIVLIGDSNTDTSWFSPSDPYGDTAAKLRTALSSAHPATSYVVTNSAVAGSTSYDALNNFSTQVTPYAPDLVIFLHGGTNDGYYSFMARYPDRYTPDAYEARVRSYRSLLDGLPKRPLILFVAAPAHAEQSDGYTLYRNLTDTDPLRNRLQSLASGWGLPFVNWQTAMWADTNWKADYLVDGVHVNSAAKDVLVNSLMSALSPYLSSNGSILNPFPTVTAFAVPSVCSSLTVSITTFTATDDVGVTGYLLTETATVPGAGAAGWTTSAPAAYTFASAGSKTLNAWAKDAAGNVSAAASAAVTITLTGDTTAPTLTAFSLPPTADSLTVPLTMTASDNVGVTGYLVLQSTTRPTTNDARWVSVAPTSFTFPSSGYNELYGWVKDAAGNISAAATASVTITLPPPPAASGLKHLNGSAAGTLKHLNGTAAGTLKKVN